MNIIEAKDLCFSYGNSKILKNVSFEAGASEVLSILGPNGAGKTTLLNCLLNLVKPSGGEIFIKGRPIGCYDRKEYCRIVSFVPQIHKPVFDFTVEEIVLMGKNPHLSDFTLPSAVEREHVSKALDELKIIHLKNRYYTQISGGELQLVLIARAIVQATQAVILDEPVAHLDLKNQIEIMKMIRKLATERKICVIMVVHDPCHALAYSDKVLLLKEGENFAAGGPDETITADNIHSVYGVRARVVEFAGRKIVIPE